MSTDSENENIRLKGRVCPSCRKPITIYALCGIYIPLESKGLFYYREYPKNAEAAFIQVGASNLKEVYKLYFISQCDCGFVSMWWFTHTEVEYLLNNESQMNLSWIYSPDSWKEMIELIKDKKIKKETEATLKLVLECYPAQDEKSGGNNNGS